MSCRCWLHDVVCFIFLLLVLHNGDGMGLGIFCPLIPVGAALGQMWAVVEHRCMYHRA